MARVRYLSRKDTTMTICFNCKRAVFKQHWVPRKSPVNIPGFGYWTCKKDKS